MDYEKNFKDFSHINAFGKQIWPCHKVGHGQPRIIICANFIGSTSQMLHTRTQGYWPFGSREEF